MLVFSTKANIWTITEAHLDYFFHGKWALSNEALHWLDLANEEFRRMPLPIVYGELMHLQAFGDSVCVFDFGNVDTAGSIDLWVMKNFGVADSWAKLFNLKVTNQHKKIVWLCPILVLEAATFLEKKTIESDVLKLISSSHTKEELETHVCSGDVNLIDLIQYEETLLWLESQYWFFCISFLQLPLEWKEGKRKYVDQKKWCILKNSRVRCRNEGAILAIRKYSPGI